MSDEKPFDCGNGSDLVYLDEATDDQLDRALRWLYGPAVTEVREGRLDGIRPICWCETCIERGELFHDD